MRSVFLFAIAVCLFSALASARYDATRTIRTYDGFGNNRNAEKQTWGIAMGPFLRGMVPINSYADGMGVPGRMGPSPRLISNLMAEAAWNGAPKNDKSLNDMHTYWGHFITGDCVNSYRNESDMGIPRFIEIPADDPYYPEGAVLNPMINFRAYPYHASGTVDYPRIPVNTQTAYLDLSFIYPSDPAIRAKVIDNSTGYIKDSIIQFIPANPVLVPIRQGTWIQGGDDRNNKTPALRSYWMLFVREHNRQIDRIRVEEGITDPAILFQEARRWNIGFFQAISVREYLAALIGHPLPPYRDPVSGNDSYDDTLDPTIDVLFAHCAFRYGHSKTNGVFPRMDNNKVEIHEGHLRVHENVYIAANWNIENKTGGKDYFDASCIFRGLANTLAGENDVGMVTDLRNFLLLGPRGGLDLMAYNIDRGREVGLPDYNTIREYLNLTRKNTWAEVTANARVQKYLKLAYGTDGPADICDPYVCGLAEDHVGTSTMGELFNYIVERQFLNMRNGDRFWFERDDQFSAEEIQTIYGTKLKDLILRNFPDVDPDALPTSAFFVDSRQLNNTGAKDSFFYPDPTKIFPGIATDFTTVDVAPAYRLSWRLNTAETEITFLLQARSNGWIGIGFDALPNTMKGADIILCRIRPDNGEGECRDSYAADVGIPKLDTELNGHSDVKDIGIVQENGYTSATFTRALDTGEVYWDKVISNRLVKIIFAFNPQTNELNYHGPTRSSERHINFIAEYVRPLGPPQRSGIPLGLIIAVGIVAAIGILYSLVVVGFIAAKTDYFKYQTPIFCYIILVGTILGYISVILTLPEQTTALCTAQAWLWGVSYMLVFGSLFAKVWRVWRIAGNTKLSKSVKVTEWDVAKPVIGLLILELIFLAIWTGVDMLKAVDVIFDNKIYATCLSKGVYWWIIFLAYKVLFLVFGVFLAVQSRNFDSALNESKQVALCLYVMLLDICIMIPIGYALMNTPIVTFIVFAFGISIPYIGVTGILFSNNLLRIMTGKEPKQVKRGGTTGTAKTKGTANTQATTATSSNSSINEDGEEMKPKPVAGKAGAKKPVAERIPLREPAASAAPAKITQETVSSTESSSPAKEDSSPSGSSSGSGSAS